MSEANIQMSREQPLEIPYTHKVIHDAHTHAHVHVQVLQHTHIHMHVLQHSHMHEASAQICI